MHRPASARLAIAAALLLVVACAGDSDDGGGASTTAAPATITTSTTSTSVAPNGEATATTPPRPDGSVPDDGNRYTPGRADVLADARSVDLPGVPVRVIGVDGVGPGFVVVLDDGTVVGVDVAVSPGQVDLGRGDVAIERTADGSVTVTAPLLPIEIDDPLPDAAVTTSADGRIAVLAGPTDRYPHAILGDDLEAARLVIIGGRNEVVIEAPSPAVFEDRRPTWADLDGDGEPEVLATVAGGGAGARIAAFDPDTGAQVATTTALGQERRWRHRIAVAPTGPDGAIELVEVRTPHIGGIVSFRAVDDGELLLTGEERGWSSHAIFDTELDNAHVLDADGDGRPELLIPSQERDELGLLRRVEDRVEVVARVSLGGKLAAGLGIAATPDDRIAVAVGLADERLLVWDAPPS